MLSREEQDAMRDAMQKSVEQSLETYAGECIAVDDLTGREWSHEWHGGEARIVADENDDGPEVEYVFQVRVELVAVESAGAGAVS